MNRLILIMGVDSPQRVAALSELRERDAHVIELTVLEEQGPGGPNAHKIAAGAALAEAADRMVVIPVTVIDGLDDRPTTYSLLEFARGLGVQTQMVVFTNAVEAGADADQVAFVRRRAEQTAHMCDIVDFVQDGGLTRREGSDEPKGGGIVDAILS